MASTTNVAAATIVVVVAGQWTKGNLIPIRVIIGGTVYILLLSGLNEAAPELAKNFGVLVLITALFIYAVPVFEGLGLLGEERKKKSQKNRRNRNQRSTR